MSISTLFKRCPALLMAGVSLTAASYAPMAGAAAYHTLHLMALNGTEGNPYGITQGADGNFYGITSSVYGPDCNSGAAYKFTPANQYSLFYRFSCTDDQGFNSDGASPQTLLPGSDGNFYGTTGYGGSGGRGTVFKLTAGGNLTTLHTFTALGDNSSINDDGANPIGVLVRTADGSFYGITGSGGHSGAGTLFRIAPNGDFSVVHHFTGGDEYGYAITLAAGSDGNIYGTLSRGGANGTGSIFRVATNGDLVTVYTFPVFYTGSPDLAYPGGTLVAGPDGALYGATSTGGGDANSGGIFRMALDGTLSVVHRFSAVTFRGTNLDGRYVAALISGTDGRLYGTTSSGVGNVGTVFAMSPAGAFETLYTFSPLGANEVAHPQNLTQDAAGNLIGLSSSGGAAFGGGRGGLFHVVLNDPLTVSVSLAPASVVAGSPMTATWSSTNATSCVTFGGVLGRSFGRKAPSGSVTITPPFPGYFVAALQCTDGNGGLADAVIPITVDSQPPAAKKSAK